MAIMGEVEWQRRHCIFLYKIENKNMQLTKDSKCIQKIEKLENITATADNKNCSISQYIEEKIWYFLNIFQKILKIILVICQRFLNKISRMERFI